jgi:hypothetical protein
LAFPIEAVAYEQGREISAMRDCRAHANARRQAEIGALCRLVVR